MATSSSLLVATLLLSPVLLLLLGRMVARAVRPLTRRTEWSWDAMHGAAPAPKPKWREGVFLSTSRRRRDALCASFIAPFSPEECYTAISSLRDAATTWTEPELFCIDALFQAPKVSFATGSTTARIRLRHSSEHQGHTEVRAVFEPSQHAPHTTRHADALHAALDTPLMRQYQAIGCSAEQMRDIEQRYRACATWTTALLEALHADAFASELAGANIARVVTRRL